MNLASVLFRLVACGVLFRNKPVNESDRAVVPDLETLSQFTNRHTFPVRETLDGKQRLMLLRRDSGGCRRLLAETQKLSQCESERGEELILGL